jgi:xylan 1,4-beta-xylosidase
VSIEVDATAPGAELEPIWSYFGYDEVNYTTTDEGKELLRTLADVNPEPVRVRTHFLFNTGDGTPDLKWGSTNIYMEDQGGNPVYDFTLVDAIMDATVDAGARPLVELGFMPRDLSLQPDPYRNSDTYVLDGGCFFPPRDYAKWGELVAAWATHVSQRYPESVSTWQWELWNEPDIAYWQGTFEEFAQLYDYTEAALHSVLPDAPLGGPAVANVRLGFLEQFLDHCAEGTNAVTGDAGTRLDMVSFHAKGGVALIDDHVQMDLGNQLRLHELGFGIVAASEFASTPIVISEADPDGCAACPVSTAPHHAYRNSSAYGAYELAMMKHSLTLAQAAGVNLQGVLTWAFTFPGSDYFAGYRALSTNGIHLPVLNAFKFLGSLSGNSLPVESSGAHSVSEIISDGVRAAPDIDALATIDAQRIEIVVWSYHDDLVDDTAPTPVAIRLAVPEEFGDDVELMHARVDEVHGNAHTAWQSQGSPIEPTASQLEELRQAMQPVVVDERVIPVDGGEIVVSFDLPRFGISRLSLVPSTADDQPSTPEGGTKRDEPETDESDPGGCSCRLSRPAKSPFFALLALWIAAVFAHRRRADRASTQGRTTSGY